MNKPLPLPLADRGPLRVMFLLTSMPVGGAETLLVNLIRGLDRERFVPELCCLKELDCLGAQMAAEIPAFSGYLQGKYDLRVLFRLTSLLRERRIDAVVTVGAGDKMFWGRLAAWRAGVPVVLSAIHSTGWPDGIGRLNRRLTRITDGFIGVAEPHGRHLREVEGFPADKVFVIPNGIDTARFCPRPDDPALRESLQLPLHAPLAGIVAALRPEKNHALFLRAAAQVLNAIPAAKFLVIGDGPERPRLEALAAELRIQESVRFLGTRSDIPALLSLLNVFLLTSHNEANPVSILEALSCGRPVVATRVGSVPEMVHEGSTGFLVPLGDAAAMSERVVRLLSDPLLAARYGRDGRELVQQTGSLAAMVRGYEDLIEMIYRRKSRAAALSAAAPSESLVEHFT
ncbi:MAG TPA: glycosyltransferase [Pirellulales bacterium]|jgi:glycosyltransferase involved in cell wall biosynthesis|nr:glycosyltransferase [Pirellulales bacterium]